MRREHDKYFEKRFKDQRKPQLVAGHDDKQTDGKSLTAGPGAPILPLSPGRPRAP